MGLALNFHIVYCKLAFKLLRTISTCKALQPQRGEKLVAATQKYLTRYLTADIDLFSAISLFNISSNSGLLGREALVLTTLPWLSNIR